jgi:hypothetical protein
MDRAAIEQLRRLDVAATVSGDLAALGELWADDLVRLQPGMEAEVGKPWSDYESPPRRRSLHGRRNAHDGLRSGARSPRPGSAISSSAHRPHLQQRLGTGSPECRERESPQYPLDARTWHRLRCSTAARHESRAEEVTQTHQTSTNWAWSEKQLNETAVSDRATLRGLTQFLRRAISPCPQTAEYKSLRKAGRFEGEFCDTLFRTTHKSLILNGEMSEWSIEHAWKACVRVTVPRVRIPFSPPHSLGPFREQ